jgi:hypothetical protein
LVIGWVTKNVLSQTPPCFGRHVKPLVRAAFAVVGTLQAAGPAWWAIARSPYIYIHKEGLCPNSGDNNRLKMMIISSPILSK